MIAFLFPGQGAQHTGMIAGLPDREPVAAVLRTVSDVLGRDVRELDGADVRTDTVAAQLGLLTVGVATAELLASDGIRPDAVVGHSIGAFAAAVVAEVLTLEEATDAVRIRAEGMRANSNRGVAVSSPAPATRGPGSSRVPGIFSWAELIKGCRRLPGVREKP